MTNNDKTVKSDNDFVLAKRINTLALITSMVSVVVLIISLSTIPWQTTIEYTRLSSEWRIPLLFIGVPTIFLFVLWRRGRRDVKTGIVPGERIALVVMTLIFISFFLGGQIYLAVLFADAAKLAGG